MTAPNTNTIEPGSRLGGPYEVIRLLHEGANTKIYLAKHRLVAKQVAIKVYCKDSVEIRHRSQWEAKKVSSITHPNVVSVFDFGLENDQTYLVFEYLEGENLRKILDREKKLPLTRVRDLFGPVCEAMNVFHGKNLVHRDLKPENIFVSTDAKGVERVVILDFKSCRELADKATNSTSPKAKLAGEIVGTPAYSSPEQCMGTEVDCRSDIYSVGCILYECLTGVSPFKGDSMVSTMSNHVADPPPPLTGDSEVLDFQHVLNRCLEKNPDDRFQTAAALKEAMVGKEVKTKPASKLRGFLGTLGIGHNE